MRKALAITVLFVMLAALTLTGVKAVVGSTLVEELYVKLEPYGATKATKAQMEKILDGVSDEKAQTIMNNVDAAIRVMEDYDAESYDDLKPEQRGWLQAYAQNAAGAIGYSFTFDKGEAKLFDEKGKEVMAFTTDDLADGKLPYTGANNVVVAVSVVAVIALAAVVVVRTKIGA